MANTMEIESTEPMKRDLLDVLREALIDDIDGSWMTTSRRIVLYRDNYEGHDNYYLLYNYRFPFIECHANLSSIYESLTNLNTKPWVSSIHIRNFAICLDYFQFFNIYLELFAVKGCVLRDCTYLIEKEKEKFCEVFTCNYKIDLIEYGAEILKPDGFKYIPEKKKRRRTLTVARLSTLYNPDRIFYFIRPYGELVPVVFDENQPMETMSFLRPISELPGTHRLHVVDTLFLPHPHRRSHARNARILNRLRREAEMWRQSSPEHRSTERPVDPEYRYYMDNERLMATNFL